ncbi:LysR substrate-binding domain-containing protein [Cupriavidus pauculus]|uniref:LysR substrate-binding domain-containing protein n=1 Tax=Cupriavidus pauculus TaxID=82633 RepID=UPI0027E4946A|nr:LysR substrate-binding domain-containing protein [Cupriavidus pauculus]
MEIHTALGLVAAGLGFTVVGASVAAVDRNDVAVVPLKTQATLVAVTRVGDASSAVREFVAALALPGPRP